MKIDLYYLTASIAVTFLVIALCYMLSDIFSFDKKITVIIGLAFFNVYNGCLLLEEADKRINKK